MVAIDFKFGTLIRTGPKLVNGGKWDADLAEWVRNTTTNADLTIYIRIIFSRSSQRAPPERMVTLMTHRQGRQREKSRSGALENSNITPET
jgi:hypothetical protein